MGTNHRDLIEQCRAQFCDPPGPLNGAGRLALGLRLGWLDRLQLTLTDRELGVILREQHWLWSEGRVVWGALVQADVRLFEHHNRRTLPANVLCSPDEYFDDQLHLLLSLARQLGELKSAEQRGVMRRRFSYALMHEATRTLRLRLPDSWCPGRAVFLTTCLIHPPHLPGGRLAQGHFPLVICPRRTDVAAVLPGALWPVALCEEWVGSEQPSVPDGGRPR